MHVQENLAVAIDAAPQHHGVEDLRPGSVEPKSRGRRGRCRRRTVTWCRRAMSSRSSEARLRSRNESGELTADRRAITPTTVWRWYTKRYNCSAFSTFEQAQGEDLVDRLPVAVEMELRRLGLTREPHFGLRYRPRDLSSILSPRRRPAGLVQRHAVRQLGGLSVGLRVL